MRINKIGYHNLKSKIEYCLKEYPETRNSDIKLMNTIFVTFYKEHLFEVDRKWCIRLVSLYTIPNQADIKRVRQKIQNGKHLFLPTDPDIRKQRKINEEEWRKQLGYNPEFRTI
jgi:hypothetical protein